MYDRKKYLRSKKWIIKKALVPGTEKFRIYDIIRKKLHITDREIRDLLKTNTITEILEGRMTENGFRPKEIGRFISM